ncbi:hypothetical protein [Mucilaginibacter sp. L196]|uniref:hypothetical protein n=1 Tax=Mucilaginibacter sp. L196 TaxID=1641870 RepID=UPI00131B0DCA|nr:hypothetical protein [Mucilaginibacter sp. L196]
MKKFKPLIALLLIICTLSSCATVFGGHVNAYQRTKPLAGQRTRPLRVGAFICDLVLFWPGLVVDFATCAIYRPHSPDAPEATPVPVSSTQGTSN